jgi:hypothetical protein
MTKIRPMAAAKPKFIFILISASPYKHPIY